MTDSINLVRELYKSEVEVQTRNSPLFNIRDYNESITPIVGLVKPKNIALKEVSSGFNQDTDKIISKGKLTGGVEKYNSIFDFSFFAPEFFTRLLLEDTIVGDEFTPGKYVYGAISGAVAVIEGGTSATYSSINKLFVTMVTGVFSVRRNHPRRRWWNS